ncbi:MAG: hypothetical protein Q8N75_05440, partial [Pseudomonadota bacterium]|nr:hypothetical protein [Pseudomonadota bacterium]
MAQTHYKAYYDAIGIRWDDASQTLAPDVADLITSLRTQYASQGTATLYLMAELTTQMKRLGDFGNQVVSAMSSQGNPNSGNAFESLLTAIGASMMLDDGNANSLNAVSNTNSALLGLAGNDYLYGGGGNDWFMGGTGNGMPYGYNAMTKVIWDGRRIPVTVAANQENQQCAA